VSTLSSVSGRSPRETRLSVERARRSTPAGAGHVLQLPSEMSVLETALHTAQLIGLVVEPDLQAVHSTSAILVPQALGL
jgi:hypothetical protein